MIEETALYGEQVLGMMQRADTHLKLLTAENEINADRNIFLDQLSRTANSDEVDPNTQTFVDELRKRYEEKYGADPNVWGAVFPHLESEVNQMTRIAAGRKLTLEKDENADQLDKTQKTAAQEVAEARAAGDETWEGMATGNYEVALESSIRSGYMSRKQADKQHDLFMKDIQSAEKQVAFREIGTDPLQAFKDLDDPGKYRSLTPEHRQEMKTHAMTAMDMQDKYDLAKAERTQKAFKLQEKSTVDQLVLDHMKGKDVSGNLIALMEAHILDSDGVKEVQEKIKLTDELAKSETKEEDPDVKADLLLGIYGSKQTKTTADVVMAAKNHQINETTYKEMLTHLTERAKQNRDEGKEQQNREFTNARERLGFIFMNPKGPLAELLPGVKPLEAEAYEQLYSKVYKEGMKPNEAADKLIQQYRPAIDMNASTAGQRARKALAIPNADKLPVKDMAAWLIANKGSMSPSDYHVQVSLLKQVQLSEQQTAPKVKPAQATGEGE
jgi:hypothetical protein